MVCPLDEDDRYDLGASDDDEADDDRLDELERMLRARPSPEPEIDEDDAADRCVVCRDKPRKSSKDQRCDTCGRYWRRKGVERPVELIDKARYLPDDDPNVVAFVERIALEWANAEDAAVGGDERRRASVEQDYTSRYRAYLRCGADLPELSNIGKDGWHPRKSGRIDPELRAAYAKQASSLREAQSGFDAKALRPAELRDVARELQEWVWKRVLRAVNKIREERRAERAA
jgi:hypothetical protein